jgi:predicted MFS family arabinose efflux permease
MLMALGVLGSVLAWSYGSMLGFRLLTGLGMAAIAPSCLISATGVGAALGIPGVVLLADAGGWQLPFYVIGALLLVLWVLLWVWLPRSQQETVQAISIFSRFREVDSNGRAWYVLGENILIVGAFSGVFTYLAAYLIETYSMSARATALPLTLAGLGVIWAAS